MAHDSGGRFELRLTDESDDRVSYEAVLHWDVDGGGEVAGALSVDGASGAVAIDEAMSAAAPPWLVDYARTALRSEWRSRQKAPAPWPRRLTRWRASR